MKSADREIQGVILRCGTITNVSIVNTIDLKSRNYCIIQNSTIVICKRRLIVEVSIVVETVSIRNNYPVTLLRFFGFGRAVIITLHGRSSSC